MPSLTVVQGERRVVTGDEVMSEIGAVLARQLPDVPYDDPRRGALTALACVAGLSASQIRHIGTVA